MYEQEVRCRECGEAHIERCDASGIAAGVPMECPSCERSAQHDPVGELERVEEVDQFRRALGEVDEAEHAVQSGAYGCDR